MTISIIVAASENGVIGRDNQLLWRLPDDLKRFKQLTLGHPMIMGRKTFESIGRPLPGRTSIIVTRSPEYRVEGTLVAHSLEEALAVAGELDTEEVFIIGGGEIYRQALGNNSVDQIYLTLVHADSEGDAFFEFPDEAEWQQTASEFHPADERHSVAFSFNKFSIKDVI